MIWSTPVPPARTWTNAGPVAQVWHDFELILTEDGGYLMSEDGRYFALETPVATWTQTP